MHKEKHYKGRYWTAHYQRQGILQDSSVGKAGAVPAQLLYTTVDRALQRRDSLEDYSISLHTAGLTTRQMEVLQLVALGMTNVEIADQLVITLSTVISYLNNIYSKLGVSSRTAAIRYALDHQLCLPPHEKASLAGEVISTNALNSRLNSSQSAGLTSRQLEVLQLVAAGLSNAEIAERLVITLSTVISYLNDVYKKLGVRSRTAAMRYAIDHRLC